MKARVLAWSTQESDPDVSEVPPLLRRRMSPLARMSAAAAMDCCRRAKVSCSDVQIVFASRHGEMGTTLTLLEQLAKGETLSPTDFSGSVHHTSLGYFTMAVKNRRPARAVAGGEASFCYGFLDALGMLGETGGLPVLLIAADEALPAPFAGLIGKTNQPYAIAFLLGSARYSQKGTVSLEMPSPMSRPRRRAARTRSSGIPALNFLHWFLEGKKSLEWRLAERMWRWEK